MRGIEGYVSRGRGGRYPPTPLASRPPFPPSCRDQGYSLKSRRQERKKRRDGRSRAEKESTADAGSLPGSLLNPDPEFATTSLTLSLGCGSFAYGRGQNHPTGLRTLDLAGFGRLARTVLIRVASGVCPRVFVPSWMYRLRVRDDGSRHGIDDKEREAEKEQGRRKRARAYVCLYILVYVSLFYSFLACTRICISLYECTLRVCMYMCICARGRLHVCGEICINANARVTVGRDDGVNGCTLVIGTDGVGCMPVCCVCRFLGREVDQDEGDRPRDEVLPSLGHCYS